MLSVISLSHLITHTFLQLFFLCLRYGGLERSNALQLKKIPANRKILQKHTKHN